MNYLTKINKSLIIYGLIFLFVVPLFGFKLLISLVGNFLLLILLIPLLILVIALISFNSLKSKVRICNECGTLSLGVNKNCLNCGADLGDMTTKNYEELNKPSERTIEINAEEIN